MLTILRHARDFAELAIIGAAVTGFAMAASGLIEAYFGALR